tara:strand:+ start:378 stop:521 length:144 start_codon:yes stop_codon:yes gene_type:complete
LGAAAGENDEFRMFQILNRRGRMIDESHAMPGITVNSSQGVTKNTAR